MRALRMMLSPAEFAYQAATPALIQTLAIGLFSLLPTLYGSGEEHTIVGEAIIHLLAGDYGDLDVVSFEEEFNALFVAQDTRGAVRQALVLDALARCLENGAQSTRRWLLGNAVEVRFVSIITFFGDLFDATGVLATAAGRCVVHPAPRGRPGAQAGDLHAYGAQRPANEAATDGGGRIRSAFHANARGS
jgi:hypothetical protein